MYFHFKDSANNKSSFGNLDTRHYPDRHLGTLFVYSLNGLLSCYFPKNSMSNYTKAPVFMVFTSLPSLCIPVIVGEISFQGNRKSVVFPYYIKKYK